MSADALAAQHFRKHTLTRTMQALQVRWLLCLLAPYEACAQLVVGLSSRDFTFSLLQARVVYSNNKRAVLVAAMVHRDTYLLCMAFRKLASYARRRRSSKHVQQLVDAHFAARSVVKALQWWRYRASVLVHFGTLALFGDAACT